MVFVHEVVDPQIAMVQHRDLARYRPAGQHQILLDIVAVAMQLLGQLLVASPLGHQIGQRAQLEGHKVDEALIGAYVVLVQHAAAEMLPYAGLLRREISK